MSNRFGSAPDAAAIEKLAIAARAALPDIFADYLADIIIKVEDFASDDVLREMGIDDPWELTGLYHGRPLSEQSIWSTGDMPPMILLYRLPLLGEWIETGVTLEALVTHVLIHEVGHHFGLSDEDMEAIEQSVSGN